MIKALILAFTIILASSQLIGNIGGYQSYNAQSS